jgi:hypothetical protein
MLGEPLHFENAGAHAMQQKNRMLARMQMKNLAI